MKSTRREIKGTCLKKAVVYLLTFCLLSNTWLPVVLAGPVDGAFMVGDGSISTNAGITDVLVHQTQSVIEWGGLDTDLGEFLNFSQQAGLTDSAVLNRVMSGVGTQFNGTLNAQGMRIFIVNPAGIVFGAGSEVNVSQLVASGLNMSNDDFMAATRLVNPTAFKFEGGDGVVENHTTLDGADSFYLIGKKIINAGTITANPGGLVVMVAGNRVLLGQPGSKIVVEMDSVTLSDPENPEDFGDVINEGVITASGGTVILAAGDVFSVPLHPQLLVNSAELGEEPVYNPADQPVRVESGIGTVIQSGGITADGGSVVLTAGDDVILAAGSTTQAIDGEVIAYAYDFGLDGSADGATTSFEEGATISVGTGLAEISGNHILFAGSVETAAGATIQISSRNLTIADTRPETVELDTLYEEDIEAYLRDGVNLDLAADELITVEYMTDGEITGGIGDITRGSGDITLRNIYADGGIYFEQQDGTGFRTSIRTVAHYESVSDHADGGSIYMDAGSGGIVAGNLSTETLSQDKVSQPGEIVLRTTNGGDIEVGSMRAEGASNTQVSAISGGDLIVNGDVESINKQTDNTETSVFSATACLIAEGDIYLNGTNYEVYSHGKGQLVSEILISAGGNVTIGSAQAPATIKAESKIAQQGIATQSTAYVVIHAGRNLEQGGTITINDQSYTPDAVYVSDISAVALKGSVDASSTPSSSVDTKTVWENEDIDDPTNFFARIEINSNEIVPLNEGPCKDCPQPPGLPPVPTVFIIMDDDFTFSKNVVNEAVDVLANDDNDSPLVGGAVSQYTTTTGGGILTEVPGGGDVTSFEYTPPENAVFVWDGESDYATFTDTFTYKAEDSEGNVSVNSATVTITVTNFLPVAQDDSYEANHNLELGIDSGAGVIQGIGTDIDADGDVLTVALLDDALFGEVVLESDGTFTYTPDEASMRANPDLVADTFTYTVDDGFGGTDTATVTIDLTNQAPDAVDDNYTNSHNLVLDKDAATGVILGLGTDTDPDNIPGAEFQDDLDVVSYTQPTYGTVSFDEETGAFTYTPDESAMLANTTLEDDTFTYTISDGFGGTDVGIVTIDLTNLAPDAQDDVYSTEHNVLFDISDLGDGAIEGLLPGMEDTDPDNGGGLFNDNLTTTLLAGPAFGDVVLESDGTFTYTPDETLMLANTTLQADTFTYTLSDGFGGTDTATVTVNLTNLIPVANPDFYAAGQDTTLITAVGDGTIEGLLPGSGDFDPDSQNPGSVFADVLSAFLDGGGVTTEGGLVTLNSDGSFTYEPPSDLVGADSFTYYVSDGFAGGISQSVQVNILVAASAAYMAAAQSAAPGLAPVEIETSGCPALVSWAAQELGVEGETMDIWVSNSLASGRGIQPCDSCGKLQTAARVLQDIDGIRVAALGQVINEFAPGDTPPTEEQMASVAQAITNNIDGNEQRVLAGEYLDALTEYVAVLSDELGFSQTESMQFAMNNYVDGLVESEDTAVAAFVAARLIISPEIMEITQGIIEAVDE